MRETYGSKVRIVFKDFPLPNHGDAFKAAEAAHCAGEQGKYWEMHDRMFADQKALGQLNCGKAGEVVNIADDRETPARDVVRELRKVGLRAVGHDPHLDSFDVDGEPLEIATNLGAALSDCDLAVVLQWHSQYEPAEIVARAPFVFDTRGRLDGPNVERL